MLVASLVLGLAAPQGGRAACSEKPLVQMDEFTARSHVIARRDVELPAAFRRFTRPQSVVLLITVDRQGEICGLRPLAGPVEWRNEAMRVVTKHWRFRPFRLDWKPVVAQFPVTVRCVPSRRERPHWIVARRAAASRPAGPRRRV
jgi:hypothetical protein